MSASSWPGARCSTASTPSLGCGALTAGSGIEPGPPAVDLRWEAAAGAGLVTLVVEARVPLGADTLADTLHRVVACG